MQLNFEQVCSPALPLIPSGQKSFQVFGFSLDRTGEIEWARLKANDSLPCRNCHSVASITKQFPRASVAHQRFLFTGEKTCIDCHKASRINCPTCEVFRAGNRDFRLS